MSTPRTLAYPAVQGRCPACRKTSLYLGAGGYIACSRSDCPEPDAAAALLCDGRPVEQRLATLRAACISLTARGFDSLSATWVLELLDGPTEAATPCPACSRADQAGLAPAELHAACVDEEHGP